MNSTLRQVNDTVVFVVVVFVVFVVCDCVFMCCRTNGMPFVGSLLLLIGTIQQYDTPIALLLMAC